MKIVLLETMGNLGMVGEVVNVRPGYARNFLLPNKKAVLASSGSVKQIEHQKVLLAHKMKKAKAKAQEARAALEAESLVIRKKAGENEKLFGSVTASDIEKCIQEKGFVVSRKAIKLEQPIRKVGVYTIPVKLDKDTEIQLSVKVTAEKA